MARLANPSTPERKVARVSNIQVAEVTGVPWLALFARMYQESAARVWHLEACLLRHVSGSSLRISQ
jgi:hypothetical protein